MLSGGGAGGGGAEGEAPESPEETCTALYLQHYLDTVENMPDDLTRQLSRIRELDLAYTACVRELETHLTTCVTNEGDPAAVRRPRSIARVKQMMISTQEMFDEKLQLVQLFQDLMDSHYRQLDIDQRKLISSREVKTNGTVKEEPPPPIETVPARDKETTAASPTPATPVRISSPTPTQHERDKEKNDKDKAGERWSKRARRSRTTTSNNTSQRDNTDDSGERDNVERVANSVNNTTHKKGIGKKKKRKARQAAAAQRSETPTEEAEAIDPDEARYCLCDQISFGEMILCDNDLCPIEWFHFSCVYLTTKPKGKWFCPKCRGDRPNVMKPKAQFLKELERYNKEKEEKA